jgi:hypothetical protein
LFYLPGGGMGVLPDYPQTYFTNFASDGNRPDINQSLKQFLYRVENQLLSEQFKSNTICFDPIAELNAVQHPKIENAGTTLSTLIRPHCYRKTAHNKTLHPSREGGTFSNGQSLVSTG